MDPSTSWYNLFKEVDNDGDDEITFDELTTCVRRELKRGLREVSHNDLKTLWCSLDINQDNKLMKDEMSHFFRRAERTRKEIKSGWFSGMMGRERVAPHKR